MYTNDQLFYMAAAEDRQTDSRALDMPSALIGVHGSNWIMSHFAEGVVLTVGRNQRCSGERVLTSTSGSFESTPNGMKYCSWQDCMWHVTLPTND
eukprot:5928378-Prymnesium_polylepis.1